MKVTIYNFNEFRITGYDNYRRFCTTGIVNPRPDSTNVPSKPYYPVEHFKRYIKRSPIFFPAFKDQEIWSNWNLNAIETSCTQDVEDILHEAYDPPTSDDISLFKG